jgi:CPA2 family monovalent cation:H+ antiporter-2
MKLPLPAKLVTGTRPVQNEPVVHIKNHLIIIGMGLNGRNVAKAAQMANIPYLILDADPDLVVEERANGQPIVFGDATHESMLHFVKIENAEVVTVSLADSPTTYRVTELVRRLNPKAHLIIRTRYLADVEDLYKAGANEVIPEEFETSVEIFSRVLSKYLIPKAEIEKLIAEVRADGYEMFRGLNVEDTTLKDLKLQVPDIEISSLTVYPTASIVGKTIGELGLRKNFSVNILAIRRGEETIPNPMANEKILAGDIVYVLGKQYSVACITSLFREETEPGCMGE